MEDAVSASTAGGSGQIVVAGAGYAGLHVALRLAAKLRNRPKVELTLVDRHDYHQVVTEWVAGDYVRLAMILSAVVLVAVSMIRIGRDTAPKELRDSNTSGAR